MKMITTKEAASERKVSVRRIQALINSGELKAEKQGRDWVINPKDLKALKIRKPGRPAKGEK